MFAEQLTLLKGVKSSVGFSGAKSLSQQVSHPRELHPGAGREHLLGIAVLQRRSMLVEVCC